MLLKAAAGTGAGAAGSAVAGAAQPQPSFTDKLVNFATNPGTLLGAGLAGASVLNNVLNPPMPPAILGMGVGQPSPVQPTLSAGGPAAPVTHPATSPVAAPAPTLSQALNIDSMTGAPTAIAPRPGMLPGGSTIASQQQLPALVPPSYASPLTSGSLSFNPSTGLNMPSSEDLVRRAALTSQGGMFAGV